MWVNEIKHLWAEKNKEKTVKQTIKASDLNIQMIRKKKQKSAV